MTETTKTPKTEHARRSLNSHESGTAGRVPFSDDPTKRFNKACTWIRQHTSKLDYGFKWEGHAIHCNTNKEVIDYFHRKRRWLGGITREKFSRHFNKEETFFFAGRRDGGQSLVMLDIDCQKHLKLGTLEGAKALAASLKRFFPNLYTEVSTNGNGMHGFFLVEATGTKTNDQLKRLEKALVTWLKQHPHDVEGVEIKGLAPTVTIENRRLVGYKSGTLAKVPRQAVERFEELLATTTFTLEDLGKVIGQFEADCVIPEPAILMPPKMTVVGKSAVTRKQCGSISGKHIDIDRLTHYQVFVEQLPGSDTIKTSGQHIVTSEDTAIGLMIIEHCSRTMNLDGSLPTARAKAFWDCLYTCGDISRCWNAKRYAAIRNYFSSLKVIDWQDETYRQGFGSDKGQAAKWRFNDQFLAELEKIGNKQEEEKEKEEKETSFIDTITRSLSFIRPREIFIEIPNRLLTLKIMEMSNQVLLLYDQAA